MEETKLKISVALCTYNGEKFLQEQLDSIVNQTMKVDQIVLSDDNSSDNTIEILEQFKNEHGTEIDIEIIRNTPGLGVVKNFESAIASCYGDIIFTSDQDDIWVKEKVAKIFDCFASDNNMKFVYSDALIIDKNKNSLNTSMWKILRHEPDTILHENALENLIHTNFVTGATMAFRKDILESVTPFPEIGMFHDHWLIFCTLCLFGPDAILGFDECLILYRQHDSNVVGFMNKKELNNQNWYYNCKFAAIKAKSMLSVIDLASAKQRKKLKKYVKQQHLNIAIFNLLNYPIKYETLRDLFLYFDFFSIFSYRRILGLFRYIIFK